MATSRTAITKYLNEIAILQDAVMRLLAPHNVDGSRIKDVPLVGAFLHCCDKDHSGGQKSPSYEPRVTQTKDPQSPSIDDEDKKIDGELAAMLSVIREARKGIDAQVRVAVARATATKRLPDPEGRYCSNSLCPDRKWFSMIGKDRPHDIGVGQCEGCRGHTRRHPGEQRTIRKGEINA